MCYSTDKLKDIMLSEISQSPPKSKYCMILLL